MSSIPSKFMEAVVSIGAPIPEDEVEWLASGFFVGRKVYPPERQMVFLITNKHVVDGAKALCLCVNDLKYQGYRTIIFPLEKTPPWGKYYSEHPDPNTDIVAIGFSPQRCKKLGLKLLYFDLDEDALSLKGMADRGLSEGEFVYTLGFPLGKVSDIIKAPFCRLGCISRVADAFLEPKPTGTFFVDAQVFPGNSGGPVISRAGFIQYAEESPSNYPRHVTSHLIGIVSHYLSFQDARVDLLEGPQMSLVTGEKVTPRAENSGLAVIHPVDRIREVVDLEWRRVFNGIVPPVPPSHDPYLLWRNSPFDRGEMPPVTPPKKSP